MWYEISEKVVGFFDQFGLIGFSVKLFNTVLSLLPGIFMTFVMFLAVLIIIRIAMKLL